MKKFVICVLLLSLIAGLILIFSNAAGNSVKVEGDQAAYLRVHIRANSNEACDQNVKYKVRDRVVEYLTPTVADCTTKEEAMRKIGAKLDEAARVADEVLRENGYTYGARASLRQEEFPTRVYDGVTLSAGVYDALILELGSGTGDNWWCVVYPPLCFASGNGNVVYKSKIAEIINKFFA
ncbi:MAG: stage II sporulation protein R [Clostridiales bacterium]|nr:stage II sporulation protein R [Clostridiales bacterium]